VSAAANNTKRGSPNKSLNKRLKVLLWLLNHSGIKPLEECSVEEARSDNKALTARLRTLGARREPMEEVRDMLIPSRGTHTIPVRLYRPRSVLHQAHHFGNSTSPKDLPILVYMHGGGFVLGGLESLDLLCRTLAALTPCLVLSVDYRLAPEHPFPCGVEDCYDAALWAAQIPLHLSVHHDGEHSLNQHSSHPMRSIALAGDSAGGNLATVVAQLARETGAFRVCQQVLLYPVIDCTCSSASYEDFAQGYGLTKRAMHWFLSHYLPGTTLSDERRKHPQVSPIYGDLRGLPPTLIQTAAFDPLRDEGEHYAEALLRAGVPTTLTRYEGVIHGFAMMTNILPQARAAVQEIVATLRTSFEA
jgi:acetyl esterase